MTPDSAEYKKMFKTKNKVAIVGFADTYKNAPFADESYEIWGLNSLFEQLPRQDVWFEIHDRKIFGIDTNKEVGYGLTREGKPYLEALKELKRKDGQPCPIFMVEKYEDMVNSYRYPLEEMVVKFDPERKHKDWHEFKYDYKVGWNGYFTNSISYMIALAIDWEFEEIDIYGVDMATQWGGEYAAQRPSCEYYIGIAIGRGIKVFIPNAADLLKTRFSYGFDDEARDKFETKIKSLTGGMEGRMKAAQQNFELHRRGIDMANAQQEELKVVLQEVEKHFSDKPPEALKKWVEARSAEIGKKYQDNFVALDQDRKQVDQYIGAIECTKEIMKIWG